MNHFLSDRPQRFTLKLPTVEHDFQVLAFEGVEQISQPYRFDIKLVSERGQIPLADLLHQPAFLAFDGQSTGFHGMVHSIARGEHGSRLTHYSLTLVPQLLYLQHSFNQRIFQQQSVPEIIAQVLKEHFIVQGDYQFNIKASDYPPRDYCTQFEESDLNFVQRLCAVEGIHYHFQHSEAGHVLVFGDNAAIFHVLKTPCVFNAGSGMVAEQHTVKHFGFRLEARTSTVARRGYKFETPSYRPHYVSNGATAEAGKNEPRLEDYRYPGDNTDAHGTLLARRALEMHRSDYQLASGDSDIPYLLSGHHLELTEHPLRENNGHWLLTRLTHCGKQPQVLEEMADPQATAADGFTQGYRNTFEAIPRHVQFRPPMLHDTPYIRGSQSAVVTGPPGEEIYCDEYGRVKVQFHWHREGQANEHSSCWLRVASSWAGDGYGSVVTPRVGMEVVVSFWEGCPDQPYISGCVFNGRNRPPNPLPANKTRSVFKSLSSPGGGGGNELRIEDRKGSEQIYVHAQRDWDQHVTNSQTIHVGNERHDTVVANSYTEHQAQEHRTTQGDRIVKIGAGDHLQVSQSQHVQAGVGQYVDAGQEIHLRAGSKVVIEAGVELTLSAGGSTIILNPSGVWLNGVVIAENAGGVPAVGSGVQLLSALLPGAALPSTPGAVPQLALANTQVSLMENAAKTGESRCLICEACRENACAL